VCRMSAAFSAALHSTLLPLHSIARSLTAEDTYALLVGSKQISVEVNADETKCTVMSREQNAGRNHNIKIDNSALQREEEFKIWEKP